MRQDLILERERANHDQESYAQADENAVFGGIVGLAFVPRSDKAGDDTGRPGTQAEGDADDKKHDRHVECRAATASPPSRPTNTRSVIL